MIRAAFERDARGQLRGFSASGHSGYAEAGSDIVCAGVSVLTTTCVNSLEALCGLSTETTVTALNDGLLSFSLPRSSGDDAQLLMRALEIGLQSMAEEYPDFLQLRYKLSN